MPLSRRRGAADELNPWPGYVDALSTLLMVIIFVLLVFVLAQAFLSVALTGRDRALDRLNRQVAELTESLSLSRGRAGELQLSAASLNRDLQQARTVQAELERQLGALKTNQGRLQAERDSLQAERDQLSARLADAELQAQSALARNAQLQGKLADTARNTDAAGQQTAQVAGQLAETRRQLAQAGRQLADTQAARDAAARQVAQLTGQLAAATHQLADTRSALDAASQQATQLTAQLADATRALADTRTARDAASQQAAQLAAQLADAKRQLAEVDRQLADAKAARDAVLAELYKTVSADKATIQARLSDIAKLNDQVQALAALRDELEKQVTDAAAKATTEAERRAALEAQLADTQKIGESARAQIARLNQQVAALRAQMEQVSSALQLAEQSGADKDVQIANLSSRLNAALASKVEELQQYRSEFFGRLRQVLQNRQDIQIVGDRFVFQSEVLFPVGSADLTPSGTDQINEIAVTLKQIAGEIPSTVNWVLRVDGHADKQPRGNGDAGNWELSAQRAINVVKLLVQDGIPPDRLAATGFGEFQPLDPADTPEAYAKNRRIELRLTDR